MGWRELFQADDPDTAPRFEPDDDTRAIALKQRKRVEAELEEA